MGEASYLIQNFEVHQVLFNPGGFSELEVKLMKELKKKKIPFVWSRKTLKIKDHMFYFLNEGGYEKENDNSNVLYTEVNGIKFLFMGDAGVEVEKDLLKKYNLQNIDVLKVGHHGSRTSSSKEFIDKVNPKYSMISVGKNNRYGHPDPEVLEILKGSSVYRTDFHGSILIKIKKHKMIVKSCIF